MEKVKKVMGFYAVQGSGLGSPSMREYANEKQKVFGKMGGWIYAVNCSEKRDLDNNSVS
jgi:hypothetical protein